MQNSGDIESSSFSLKPLRIEEADANGGDSFNTLDNARSPFIKRTKQTLNVVDNNKKRSHKTTLNANISQNESSDSFNETDNHKSSNRNTGLL